MRTTRREVLALAATGPLAAPFARPKRERTLRIAQLTDMHVQPERGAGEGFRKAIEAAQTHKPDLLLMTGDLVMDVMGSDLDRADKQLAVFREAVKDSAGVPVRYCIGNHDVWGWNNLDKYSSAPLFGKRWAQEKFELAAPYYHFDQGGWRIVVLDSTHRDGDGPGYTARLDDEQFGWLGDLLENTPATMPVLVASHIPLFCACAFLDGDNEKKGDWVVPGSWMHIDFRRIKTLFRKHPNVKAALSGHIHLADRVDYLGVSYFCNGAVSAGWWGGPYQEFENGYAIVDLFDDGSVENRYMEYEWEVRP
jgi:3',5'-cyclic-AMP phosphodiesterase